MISKLCLIVLSVVFNLKSSACGKAVFVVSSSSYCVGISDTFTNNSTGNFTKFIWKWGDGTTNTTDVTQVNHNHTFPKGGTYTVTLILDSGGVCLDSQSKVVIIQKLPNVNAGANFSICENASSYSLGSTIAGQTWSGTGVTGTSFSPSTLSGVYTLTFKYDSAGCINTDTRTATVNAAPTAGFSFSPNNVCANSPDSFKDKSVPSSGLSYSWDFGNGSSATSQNPIYTYNSVSGSNLSYTVKLKVTNAKGCNDAISKSITLKGLPDPWIDTASHGTLFTNCSFTSASTTYTFKITNKSSTASTDSVTDFTWGDGGTSSKSTWALGATSTHAYTKGGAFSFSVKVTGKNGCVNSRTYTFFNGSNPALGLSTPGSTDGCTPVSFTFTVDTLKTKTNTPSTQYVFHFDDGSKDTTFIQPAPPTFSHLFIKTSCSAPANYFTLTGKASNPCGYTNATITTILVSGHPVADFMPSSNPGCINKTITMKNKSSSGNEASYNFASSSYTCDSTVNYLWSVSPDSNFVYMGGTDTFSQDPQMKFTKPGVYKVKLRVDPAYNTKCGPDSVIQSIIIDSIPVAKFTITPKKSCLPFTSTVTNQSTGGALHYRWKVNKSSGYSYTSGTDTFSKNPVFSFSDTGKFIITVVVANGCSTVTAVDTVLAKDKPVISMPSVFSKCDTITANTGTNLKFKPTYYSQFDNITSYSWTLNGAASFTSSTTSNSQFPVIKFPSSSTYLIKVNATNACGTSKTVSETVNIWPKVKANAGNDTAICKGKFTKIGGSPSASSGTSPYKYLWTKDTLSLSSKKVANPNAFPVVSTIYVLHVTDSNGCIDSDNVNVTINPLPSAYVIPNDSICAGVNKSLGAAAVSGHTYTWTSNPVGFTSASSNPSVSPASTTIYTLVEKDTITGCVSTNSVTIKVNPLPSAIVGSSTSICNSSSVSIGAASVAGHSYSWTSKPSGFTSTTSNPTVSPITTTTYKLVETITTSGCNKSDSVKIIVNPLPLAKTGNDTSICAGKSLIIGTTVIAGHTYSWTSNPSVYTSALAKNTVTPASTITYYLTEKITSTTCTNNDSIVVTVNPLPSASTGGNKSICNGATTTIGAASVLGNTYSWTSNPTGYLSSSSKPSVSPIVTTEFILVETTSFGCLKKDSLKITVNPLPIANVGLDDTICGGDTVHLGATSVAGNTYSWVSSPSGFTSPSSNPSVAPLATTLYILSETITATGCSKTDSVTVTVNPFPTLSTGGSQIICSGSSTTIGATSSASESYLWTSKPGIWTSTSLVNSVSPLVNTTYYLFDSIKTTGCHRFDSITINVSGKPALPSLSANSPLCVAQTLNLKASSVASATYSWTGPNSFSSLTQNPSVSGITLADSGVYKLVITIGTCKSDTDTIRVRINPLPTVNAGSNTSICLGKNTSIGLASIAGHKYSWSSNPSGFTSIIAKPSVSPISTTIYNLVETITSTGCKDSNVVTVKINQLPKANAGFDTIACYNTLDTLGAKVAASGGTPGYTYSWDSAGVKFSSKSHPAIIPPNTTNTYHLTVKDTNGCIGKDTVTIKVNPKVNAFVIATGFICYGIADTLYGSATGGTSPYTYSWSSTPSGFTSFASTPLVNPLISTRYSIKSSDKYGCFDTSGFLIKVNPSLSVKADTTQTICLGGNSTLIAKVTGGTPGYSYTWSPTAGISSASTKTPNATPLTNTTYTVVISDTNKCTAQDSVFIKVLSPVGNNSIMPGQFICYNTIPSTIIGSNPTGGNGIFSYQWQDSTSGVAWADIITATSQNYTPVALKKTTYFRRKVSSSACTGKQINISVFDTLTVDPQIFPNAHPTSSFICNGVTDTLDASLSTGGTGKFTYAWKSSPKGFASTLKKPSTGSLSISSQFFLQVTDSMACSDTTSTSILVDLPIKVKISSDTFLCYLDSSILDASMSSGGTGSYSYLWSSIPSGFANSSQKPSTGSLAGNTRFKLQITDAKGCVDTNGFSIKINPQIIPNAIADTGIICYNSGTKLMASAKGGSGGFSYNWGSKPIGFSSLSANPSTSNLFTTTYFQLNATDIRGCSDTTGTQIKVNLLPIVNAGLDTNICINDSLFTLGGYSPSKGVWSGNSIIDSVKGIFNPLNAGKGSYNLIYKFKDSITGCINYDTMQMNVRPLAVQAFSHDTLGCKTVAVSFKNTTTGASGYSWTFGDGNSSILKSPVNSYTAIGKYKVTLIATTSFGCKDTLSDTIRITQIPVSNFTKTADSGCAPVSIGFTNTSAGEIYTYHWDFGNKDTSILASPASKEIYKQSKLQDSIYFIQLRTGNLCGTNTFIDSVKSKPLPFARFVNQDTGCAIFKAIFNNQSFGAPDSFLWNLGNGKTSTQKYPVEKYTDGVLGDSTYFISLVAYNSCGSDTAFGAVTATPKTVTSLFKASRVSGCAPLTVKFDDYSIHSAYITWDYGDGNKDTAKHALHTFTKSGTYQVIEYANDYCGSDSSVLTIQVHSLPIAKFAPSKKYWCVGDSVTFNNSSSNTASTVWYFGDGDTSIIFTPKHSFTKAGTYAIKLSCQSPTYACQATYVDTVVINPLPSVNTGGDQTICIGQSIYIGSTAVAGIGYSWTSNPTGYTSFLANPKITPKQTVYYVLKETITSTGCFNIDSANITVTIPVTSAGSDRTICPGDTISIGSTSLSGYTYKWTSVPAGFSSTSASPSVNPTSTTFYYLTATITASSCSYSDTVTVNVNKQPSATVGASQSICIGQSVKFGGSAVKNHTYSWISRPFGFVSTNANPTDTPKVNTTYILTETDTLNGCKKKDSVIVTVKTLPATPTVTQNGPVCSKQTLNLFASNVTGATYSWTGPNSFSSTQQNPAITNATSAATGKYYVRSVFNGCSSFPDSISATVYKLPVVSAGIDRNICINDSLYTISGSPSGGVWSGTAIVDSANGVFDPAKPGIGSYNLIYKYTDAITGCLNRDTMQMSIRPLAVPAFSHDTLACKNVSVKFKNNSTGAKSYKWIFGDGNTSLADTGTNSYTAIGKYKVSLIAITNIYGCRDTVSDLIRITEIPTPSFTNALDSGCAPVLDSFKNTSTGETYSYYWDFGNGDTSTAANPKGSHLYIQSNLSDSIYKVVLQVKNLCGYNTYRDSIKVKPIVHAGFTFTPDSGCSPITVKIKNLSYGAATKYSWNFGGINSNQKNPGNQIISTTTDTIYTLFQKVQNGCSTDTTSRRIKVSAHVVAKFKTNQTSGCEPITVQFTDYSLHSTHIYWDFADSNSDTLPTPIHTFTKPGTYNILLIDSNGCSHDTVSTVIVVHPYPTVSFTNSGSYCTRTAIDFNNTSTNTYNVNWDFGDSSTHSTIWSPAHIYKDSGLYIVKLNGLSNTYGCKYTVSDSVRIYRRPDMNFSAVPQGCAFFHYKVHKIGEYLTSYTWDFGDGNSSADTAPLHIYTNAGTYNVTMYANNQYGCKDTVNAKVTVIAKPVSKFTQSLSKVCSGPIDVQFSNQSSGAVDYLWDFGNGKSSNNTDTKSTFDSSGIYTISLVSANSNQCSDTSFSKFTIYPKPSADFIPIPADGCVPLPVQFENRSQNATKFYYSFGDGQWDVISDPLHIYTKPGLYDVHLKVTIGGMCSDSITHAAAINVHPLPKAEFDTASMLVWSPVVNDFIYDGIIKFMPKERDSIVESCIWDFGDGKVEEGRIVTHNYMLPDTYIVTQIAITKYGCKDTTSKKINLRIDQGFEIVNVPNVFTPNGDGLNDVFKPVFFTKLYCADYEFQVFDRWGELVFETKKEDFGWDGTINGKKAPMDVYIWQVKCKYMSYGDGFVDPAKLKVEPEAKTDDFKTLKGNVTLLR